MRNDIRRFSASYIRRPSVNHVVSSNVQPSPGARPKFGTHSVILKSIISRSAHLYSEFYSGKLAGFCCMRVDTGTQEEGEDDDDDDDETCCI